MLRNFPHGEDHGATAGGDTTALLSGKQKPQYMHGSSKRPGFPPPGEDGLMRSRGGGRPLRPDNEPDYADQIENIAAGISARVGAVEDSPDSRERTTILPDFLRLVREAEDQALLYVAQVNRRGWTQAYRAFHNEHFVGSKYTKADWRNRSKIFRPKTRSAVRKDMAAVAASLFGNIKAISCQPGDDGNPQQRAAAAVIEQLVNYRTDGAISSKAAMPWFLNAMGSRQNSVITGICLSKQYWKLELRKLDEQEEFEDADEETGEKTQRKRDVWVPDVDRPECDVIPPENFVIDPSADWRNPAQSAAFIIIKWPMQLEEVRAKQEAPLNPWLHVSEDVLQTAAESGKFDMAAIRRSREVGLDRFDEVQTGTTFKIVWVYETFMRYRGEDWTFLSIGDRAFLTEPRLVRDVYPEQYGERPLTMGYGSLEAHRIFPMGPVESWQQHQVELNDIVNLSLDAIKQNVMPVAKVVRGRNIDLDQVKRRSYGSTVLLTDKDDLTWDRPGDVPPSVPVMERNLELEFDDLAGQFNNATVENNNALARTLGGLKLVAGTANAVQEFDIRVWIETWTRPTLAQIVRLEQYYESDPIVLAIAGNKAKLMQKHGINEITDELLEEEVTIRVSAGLGAGDPQARLAKFTSAFQIVAPIAQQSPKFQSGEYQVNIDAVMDEVFGAAGYDDGGERFITKGQPQPNPMQGLAQQELQSKIEKNQATAKGSILQGLAAVAKVDLGNRQLEADNTNTLLDRHMEAVSTGFEHGQAHRGQVLDATRAGHEHGVALAQHHLERSRHELEKSQHALDAQQMAHEQAMGVADHQRGVAQDQMANANAQADRALQADNQQQDRQSATDQANQDRAFQGDQAQQDRQASAEQAAAKMQQSQRPTASAQPPAGGNQEQESELSAKLSELIALLSKPKRIVRDSQGNISSVERG